MLFLARARSAGEVMKKIVILGASGFGLEAAWIVERINRVSSEFELIGFCDDDSSKWNGTCGTYPLLGPVENVATLFKNVAFFCAVGDNRARQKFTERARSAGLEPVTLKDPGAVIAPDAVIGAGSFIGIGSVVSVGSCLGEGVIVNHQVTVGHDALIGNFAQLCPGVCLSGGCEVGEGALLGTNAGTIPLKKLGAWSVLGAGTTALKDIPPGATVVRLGAR